LLRALRMRVLCLFTLKYLLGWVLKIHCSQIQLNFSLICKRSEREHLPTCLVSEIYVNRQNQDFDLKSFEAPMLITQSANFS